MRNGRAGRQDPLPGLATGSRFHVELSPLGDRRLAEYLPASPRVRFPPDFFWGSPYPDGSVPMGTASIGAPMFHVEQIRSYSGWPKKLCVSVASGPSFTWNRDDPPIPALLASPGGDVFPIHGEGADGTVH